ncbi:MAG: hypothetical protein JJU29_18500 [Verrucomicrobia bacterium]|nr:hypothetical protein [Verrucomicrobiota bacterium]MCH8512324.1 hypothetical protein [Kiritimatiellia bacterium]
MSDKETKLSSVQTEESTKVTGDLDTLLNALRLEREKNEVLLSEVVALEDELVNRQLGDFAGVISEQSKDFWREQLLSNRDSAVTALEELREAKAAVAAAGAKEIGTSGRRPLHNRETARPVSRGGVMGQESGSVADADSVAVRIRNRAQELSKVERIPFSTAFQRAEKEICGEVK